MKKTMKTALCGAEAMLLLAGVPAQAAVDGDISYCKRRGMVADEWLFGSCPRTMGGRFGAGGWRYRIFRHAW